jgi:thioredoxin-like negative regulator of GroEL
MSRKRTARSMRRAVVLLFRTVLVILICCCMTSAYGQSAPPSYKEAYHAAAKTGKPLLVLVGAQWCHHCVVVKDELLPKLKKQGLLDQVAYGYVDYDSDPHLVGQLVRGQHIPEMVMYCKSEEGWKVTRLMGGASLNELEQFIRAGLPEAARLAAAP